MVSEDDEQRVLIRSINHAFRYWPVVHPLLNCQTSLHARDLHDDPRGLHQESRGEEVPRVGDCWVPQKGEDDPFVYRVQVLDVEVKIGKRYERRSAMCHPHEGILRTEYV